MFLALNGIITFGQIISLTMISGGISDVAIGLGRNIINIRSSKPIIDKFNKSLEKETVKDTIDIKYINSISTEGLNVEFENNVVLNDVSIRFDEAKKYAIIGSSGSGKSTLVNSLLSFNDYSGNIYIDDCELKKINKTSFYELISYIPQKSFIIEGTIKDNLNFYDNYSDEELNEVIKIVNLQDKIESLPEGMNTYIGEDGNMLSGGEKQRINIARAILRKKMFFILDEFTSALDNANSASIENYMLSLKDTCIISITHRLNEELLKLYDEIIFMHHGSIVEKGKFDYLMEKRGYFYAMFNSLEN